MVISITKQYFGSWKTLNFYLFQSKKVKIGNIIDKFVRTMKLVYQWFWPKVASECVICQDGYRDGVDIGEDASLQAGHDAGFCETSLIFHLAKMRGSVM